MILVMRMLRAISRIRIAFRGWTSLSRHAVDQSGHLVCKKLAAIFGDCVVLKRLRAMDALRCAQVRIPAYCKSVELIMNRARIGNRRQHSLLRYRRTMRFPAKKPCPDA